MCCWYSPMPEKSSVGTELEDLREAMVGGDIEVTYPFEDEVKPLNESGKINGLP